MNEYRDLLLGAIVGGLSFFVASLARVGRRLEEIEHLTASMFMRILGLQLTLMPTAAAMAGWLVATQAWHPLSVIPLGVAAGWGGFTLGDLIYDIFVNAIKSRAEAAGLSADPNETEDRT